MRSTAVELQTDERTTKARIRDAAIDCIAEHGLTEATARRVAAAAGVSPGLVIHHFGSMDGLRIVCDEHVAATIRDLKAGAMAAGTAFDPLGALRTQAEGPNVARYLARTLVEASPHVAQLVDELVADAIEYVSAGVETGMIRPSNYPRERAAILTVWSLGALVLHEHLERLIGIDITSSINGDPKAASSYIAPVLEILGKGLVTETTVHLMSEAFVDPTQEIEST